MTLSPKNRDRLIGLASPAVLLLLWEAGVRIGWVDARFFPAPSTIAGAFLHLARSGELWDNLSASLARLLWGFSDRRRAGPVAGLGDGSLSAGARDGRPAGRGQPIRSPRARSCR